MPACTQNPQPCSVVSGNSWKAPDYTATKNHGFKAARATARSGVTPHTQQTATPGCSGQMFVHVRLGLSLQQ